MSVPDHQHIAATDVAQFRDPKSTVILTPTKYKDGKVIYPYAEALK